MKTLFAGSVAKYTDRIGDNEDIFVVAEDGSSIVVCDGASESYDAKTWAALVAQRFSGEPLSHGNLAACVGDYVASVNPDDLSWSRQMAFARGSFSTLIRVEAIKDDVLSILTIGDSLVVLTDGVTIGHMQPYESSAQFDERPLLLSTLAPHNEAFTDEALAALTQHVTYPLDQPSFVLCMTDALGAWLLSRTEAGDASALEDLLSVRSYEELAQLVERERAAHTMRRDDSTLIIAMP